MNRAGAVAVTIAYVAAMAFVTWWVLSFIGGFFGIA